MNPPPSQTNRSTRNACEIPPRPSFWRAYDSLEPRVREAARRAYRMFLNDPSHPALRFKKLGGYEHVWSVRINEQYRAVGERHGDTVIRMSGRKRQSQTSLAAGLPADASPATGSSP